MSSWLSALPIADHGFHLNKGEFRDALCLTYDSGHLPMSLNISVVSGKKFSVDHAMTCHLGGFLTVRHNDIRDLPLSALFRTHEQTKKREYGQRIQDDEHGVFTPLVFSTSGAMGREAITFYKWLANYYLKIKTRHISSLWVG